MATLMLTVVAITLAVHDEDFQLDGDVDSSTETHLPTPADTQAVDWDQIITAGGLPVANADLPDGFADAGFERDFLQNTNGSFNTSDASTFATGSKDTLSISPGWQCSFSSNVNSKTDVMNAYSVGGTNEDGDEIIYFALERNANTGTANVGFWFLQSEVSCDPGTGTGAFVGNHTDGDILIVSEFSNGGTVSSIFAYRWTGDDNTGFLNPTPVGGGGDCRAPSQEPNDALCAAANTTANGTNGTIETPWLTSNKNDGVGNELRTSEFFEGGINLTDLNLGGKCFNTFIGDTRSSTSLTATIFDYALGTSGECTSGVVTTPQGDDGGAIPATIGAAARVVVRDHADITVTGADTFGGTVTFHLCGPDVASGANCATGGVQIGDPVAVVGSAGVASLNSAEATLTSAGNYCWRAEYSGDPAVGVPASSDPTDTTNQSECFSIGPEIPTLTTQAGLDVTLGDPITDTATLTGTAKQPGDDGVGPGATINATAGSQDPAGGTITWTVQGPDDCDPSGLTVTGSPATVSGDNTYGPVSATPTAIGVYTFVAEYSGSSPNTTGAGPSGCPPDPVLDGDEEVTVGGTASLATDQDWLPNDTATLTGDTNLTGTLTFQLYTGDNCGVTDGDAVAGQSYSPTVANAPSGSTFSTSNTTFVVKEADSGDYSWLVTYVDDNLESPDPVCETTDITIVD